MIGFPRQDEWFFKLVSLAHLFVPCLLKRTRAFRARVGRESGTCGLVGGRKRRRAVFGRCGICGRWSSRGRRQTIIDSRSQDLVARRYQLIGGHRLRRNSDTRWCVQEFNVGLQRGRSTRVRDAVTGGGKRCRKAAKQGWRSRCEAVGKGWLRLYQETGLRCGRWRLCGIGSSRIGYDLRPARVGYKT